MEEEVQPYKANVVGKLEILKYDANGIEVYRHECSNIIKNCVGEIAKSWWTQIVSAFCPNFARTSTRITTSYEEIFKYVYLVETSEIPDATKDQVFPDASVLIPAYIDRSNQTIGDNPNVGITKSEDSWHTVENGIPKVKFSYEWGLSKGNGRYNAIIHARAPLSTINTGYTGMLTYDTLLSNGKPMADYNGLFAIYIADNGHKIMCKSFYMQDNGLGTFNLWCQRLDTTTGVGIDPLEFEEWKSFNGNSGMPGAVGLHYSNGRFSWVFGINYTTCIYIIDGGTHYRGSLTNGTDGIVTSIDATYAYILSGVNLYRFNHTVNLTGAVLATEYVTVSNNYLTVFDNKAFVRNGNSYHDLAGANWTTHSVISQTVHKYCYPSLQATTNNFVTPDGIVYWRDTLYAFRTGYAGGENSEFHISYHNMLTDRQYETAFAKFPLIEKSASEVLKINYTFSIE